VVSTFGVWLQERRRSESISTLAQKADLSVSSISRLENKEIEPTMVTVVRVCRAFELSWEGFYGEAVLGRAPLRSRTAGGDGYPTVRQVSELVAQGSECVARAAANLLSAFCERQIEGFDRKRWGFGPVELYRLAVFGDDPRFPFRSWMRPGQEDMKEVKVLSTLVARELEGETAMRPGDMALLITARGGREAKNWGIKKLLSGAYDNLRLEDVLVADRLYGRDGDVFGVAFRMAETRIAGRKMVGSGDEDVIFKLLDWLIWASRRLSVNEDHVSVRELAER
jgi:transcriptional regulator with XRE-family HTH domain